MKALKRSLKNLGEQRAVLGLGGASLVKNSLAEGVATVKRALELGIEYFDTAPYYCQGVAQTVLGTTLEKYSSSHFLATKIGFLKSPQHHRSIEALEA